MSQKKPFLCRIGFHETKDIYRMETDYPTFLFFPWVPTGRFICKKCGQVFSHQYSGGEEDVGQ